MHFDISTLLIMWSNVWNADPDDTGYSKDYRTKDSGDKKESKSRWKTLLASNGLMKLKPHNYKIGIHELNPLRKHNIHAKLMAATIRPLL